MFKRKISSFITIISLAIFAFLVFSGVKVLGQINMECYTGNRNDLSSQFKTNIESISKQCETSQQAINNTYCQSLGITGTTCDSKLAEKYREIDTACASSTSAATSDYLKIRAQLREACSAPSMQTQGQGETPSGTIPKFTLPAPPSVSLPSTFFPSGTSTFPNIEGQNLPVFITAETYDGNLGGLEGANQKCQQQAVAKGLSGNYQALLATTNDGYYYYPPSQKVTAAQEQAAKAETLVLQFQKTRYNYMWGSTVNIPAGQTKVFKYDPSKWLECGKQLVQLQIGYQTTYLSWCKANVETYRSSPCCKIVDGKLQPKTCCKDYKNDPNAASKDLTYSEAIRYCGLLGMADRCSDEWIAKEKKICEDQVTEITAQLQASLAKLNAITNPGEYLVAPFPGCRPEFYFGCNGYGGGGCYGVDTAPPSVKITVGREIIPSEQSSGFILTQFNESIASYSGFDMVPVGIFPGQGDMREGRIYISIQNLDSASPRRMDLLFYCPGATNPSEAPAELNLIKTPPELFMPRQYYKNATFSFNNKNSLSLDNLIQEIASSLQSSGFVWSGMIPLPEHTASGVVINNAGYLGNSCNNWTNNTDKFNGSIFTQLKYMMGIGQNGCNKKYSLICTKQPE